MSCYILKKYYTTLKLRLKRLEASRFAPEGTLVGGGVPLEQILGNRVHVLLRSIFHYFILAGVRDLADT